MTKHAKHRYDEPELLGDILKRLLEKIIFRQERKRKMDDFFDDYDGLEWQDFMILGPLSEDITREKRDRERARREWDDDDEDDYWEWLNRK